MQVFKPGSIISGPFWPEKVRVVSVKPLGANRVRVEAVGVQTNTFYNPILSNDDLEKIQVLAGRVFTFDAPGKHLFLFIEAHRIRNAFQFDPLYAVNVSQVDPLPHQIDAVYHYMLQGPRIRFLLADDPGAGKTVMAGLLMKELKYRGLVERTLIVVPGHLKDQWLREMKDRFQENFIVVNRSVINATWGQNIWQERNQIITSLDFAKQDDVMFALKSTHWDLIIVDEAHKMSAYKYGEKINKTERYKLGEMLSSITNYLLFLTATPHRGDPENFRLFLDLLQPGFFATTKMLEESIHNKDNPLFLRRLKEDLKDFESVPLFPPRDVKTIRYYLSDDEMNLYNAVTEYVAKHFNQALAKEKRNVAFAMTILQRRLASSIRAVRKSLDRRKRRLQELYEKGQLLQEGLTYTEDYLEDLEERERWQREEELLEKLTSAETLDELKKEIEKLDELILLAKEAEKKEIETKLNELRKVMEAEEIKGTEIKLLIFTEAKDTLEYLVEKLRKWGYSVAYIHGGMNLDARIRAEAEFRNRAQIMVSTEAGGEGINLQFCWLMVNYDIPWNPNRLEQRMGRIHRYGQEHEVHIYNLVAVNTKEGRILDRLFEKLNRIKEHLGSDRVFDVIGDLPQGKKLRDLILDAIANRRTLEDILADFERVPDEEAIEKARQASMEALATRYIDLTRILSEQREAKENRLVPEYVEEFFRKAAGELGIKMERRQDGFWRIPHVPFDIRNRPYDFKAKYGEVHREYLKISFDKEKARKGNAEFVSMGHPLMEAVIEVIFERLGKGAESGSVFFDPEGRLDGFIWFLEAEMKDGMGLTAGRRLFSVYQAKHGDLKLINPAILWDLKPADSLAQGAENIPPDKDTVITFCIENGLESYRNELLERRRRDAEIKKKYGIRSLDHLIAISETKLTDYYTRQAKGENIPIATIQNEERNKEGLLRKRERLLREIELETHLAPQEPKVLAVVRVVPAKESPEDMRSDAEVERIGMEVAMRYEREHQRNPEDVSALNLGYDIRSVDPQGNYRYIEVKARAREGAIALTPNEWLMAQRLKDEYWLYVVENAASEPVLYTLQNPAERLKPEEEISIVRYIVKNWKDKAEAISS